VEEKSRLNQKKKRRIRFDSTNELAIMFHLNKLNELIRRERSLGKRRSVSMLTMFQKPEEEKKKKKKN